MKYNIVPNCSIAYEIEDAKSAADAMEQFATKMDLDMNTYFKAVPAEHDQTLSSLAKRALRAADQTLGRDLSVLGKAAKEDAGKMKDKYHAFKARRAERNMRTADAEMPTPPADTDNTNKENANESTTD